MMQLLVALLLLGATAQAHYTFPRLIINGKTEATDWGYNRRTKNYQSNGPVTSVTSPDIRCYQLNTASQVATVTAGVDEINFASDQQVNHPGPVQYYMAKVPAGQSLNTWNGDGNVWFKVHTEHPTVTKDKQLTWPGQNEYKLTPFTIPKALPDGDYLIRAEHIALHQAMKAGGAQFYMTCAQVKVTGGGSGTPGPLVAFPGAYSTNDPGIVVNINYPAPTNYTPPGPPVWTGE